MTDVGVAFSWVLKQIRGRYAAAVDRASVSQEQFAEFLQTPDRTYRRYESGASLAPLDWVARVDTVLANAFPEFKAGELIEAWERIVGEAAASDEGDRESSDDAASAEVDEVTAGRPRLEEPESPDSAEGASREALLSQGQLDSETRAAMRAFLQRSEVRISTVHRVAGSFLGGAGLLLLLPLFLRDGFPKMYTAMSSTWDAGNDQLVVVLVSIVAVASIALALLALWLLLEDLIGFYFTGHTFESHSEGSLSSEERAKRVFHPRFILNGLALPEDEVSTEGRIALDHGRNSATTKRAVIPDDDKWRERLDLRIQRVWPLEPYGHKGDKGVANDDDRRRFLYRMAATWDRPIAEEVAKTEAIIVRHVLGIRIVVMRYTKALLIMLTAAVVTLVATGITDYGLQKAQAADGGLADGLPAEDLLLVAALYTLWAPFAAAAVTAPLRWIYKRNRGLGELADAYRDERLTQYENVAVVVCVVGFFVAGTALVIQAYELGNRWGTVIAVVLISAFVWARVTSTWSGGLTRSLRSVRFTASGEQP